LERPGVPHPGFSSTGVSHAIPKGSICGSENRVSKNSRVSKNRSSYRATTCALIAHKRENPIFAASAQQRVRLALFLVSFAFLAVHSLAEVIRSQSWKLRRIAADFATMTTSPARR